MPLREFRPTDLDALWRIDQLCFMDGISYSRDELAYYISMRGAFTLVADTDGTIAAYIVGFRDRRGVGHIITIDVLPDHRRSGVGSQLLAAAEQRLADSGCARVLLEVAVDNAPAIAFYKRHHYSVLKTIPRYYLNSLDALLMGKTLPPPSA